MGCLVTGCEHSTDDSRTYGLLCSKHWAMVPGATRQQLRHAIARVIADIVLATTPDPGSSHRASHEKLCERCGRQYIDHPVSVHLPFLNVLCDGTFVKL